VPFISVTRGEEVELRDRGVHVVAQFPHRAAAVDGVDPGQLVAAGG
jgi:hypothetical protein